MQDIINKNDNLVIISNIEWGYLKQRHQNFAITLKNDFNVIFVESTAKRNPSLKDIPRIINRLLSIFKKGKQKYNNDSEGINIITPIVFPSTYTIFRLVNSLFFSRFLAHKIKSKCNTSKKTAIISYLPTSTVLDILHLLKHNVLIYDCVSNFEGVEGMPADTVNIEKQLIKKSNMVFTDCDYLFNKHAAMARKIELIEPGVDSDLFGSIQGEVCNEIKKIIYYGAIYDKIDFSLLQYLSEKGIEIIMIGPIKFQHEFLNSTNHKPQIKHRDLPNALAEADALIIPYIINEFMLGVIPAKFFECFATGKPIITTYSKNYARYDNLILQGKSHEEIYQKIINISKHENKKKQQERINIARNQDWKILGNKIKSYINSTL